MQSQQEWKRPLMTMMVLADVCPGADLDVAAASDAVTGGHVAAKLDCNTDGRP